MISPDEVTDTFGTRGFFRDDDCPFCGRICHCRCPICGERYFDDRGTLKDHGGCGEEPDIAF